VNVCAVEVAPVRNSFSAPRNLVINRAKFEEFVAHFKNLSG
jgi:hypothetical protein